MVDPLHHVTTFNITTQEWNKIEFDNIPEEMTNVLEFWIVQVGDDWFIVTCSTLEDTSDDNASYTSCVARLDLEQKKCHLLYSKTGCISCRTSAVVVGDSKRNQIVMVCGLGTGRGYRYLTDVIAFDLSENDWKVLGEYPNYPALYGSSGLLWKERYLIIVGGGVTSCETTSDIICFDLEMNDWKTFLHEPYARDQVPIIYPRVSPILSLISNKYASKFMDVPNNGECNTLFMYGGIIDAICQKRILNRVTHEVILFPLDENKFVFGSNIDNTIISHMPLNLTDFCNPGEVIRIHQHKQENPSFNWEMEEDQQDDSKEFKILPPSGGEAVYYQSSNGCEYLYVFPNNIRTKHGYHYLKIALQALPMLFSSVKHGLNDINISFQ